MLVPRLDISFNKTISYQLSGLRFGLGLKLLSIR
jgi:hypothetical protein